MTLMTTISLQNEAMPTSASSARVLDRDDTATLKKTAFIELCKK
jgi:hypothetical protein